jgi:hypothetical protein
MADEKLKQVLLSAQGDIGNDAALVAADWVQENYPYLIGNRGGEGSTWLMQELFGVAGGTGFWAVAPEDDDWDLYDGAYNVGLAIYRLSHNKVKSLRRKYSVK